MLVWSAALSIPPLQVSAAVGIAVLGGLFYTVIGAACHSGNCDARAFSVTLVGIAVCHFGGALLAAGLGTAHAESGFILAVGPRSIHCHRG